ncbi:MAG: hypothetical protein SOX69_08840 [Oscillospiraceae bacterium]|nr:hypothetical protein [Oscillospiraceae bacterium]
MKLRESSKAALGGIVAALSVCIMLATYISPLLVYTAPPFAGLLLIFILKEIGYSWAFGTYAAVSLLSVFIIADKESAVFFTFFFGYYPILRTFLCEKIRIKPISFLTALFVFNVSLYISVWFCTEFFGVDYSEFTDGGRAMMLLFVLLMNIVFVAYDYLFLKLSVLYDKMLSGKVKKFFRH